MKSSVLEKKRITVLGAGFGGLKAAWDIGRNLKKLGLEDRYEIILIDRNSYHTYYPTLYEVATTSKNLANQIDLKKIVTIPLAEIFENKPVRVVQEKISELDLLEGDIHSESGKKYGFDYLVLALGTEVNYFDIPGLEENSISLKSFIDAVQIRDTVWNLIEGAPKEKRFNIVVGGAGSTGVELAGELKSWLCQLSDEKTALCNINLQLVQATPTVLPGFHPRIIDKVTKRLNSIGVEILAGEGIQKVEKNQIHLSGGRLLPFDVLIWTGGVKAASLMGSLPIKKEPRGRAEVSGAMFCLPQTPDLELAGKIYGIGDSVCVYDPKTGKPIPQIAEAAIEQGKIAAHNIIEDIKFAEKLSEKPRHRIFQPRSEYPYVIPVGAKYAVAKIGPFIVCGFPGWILKGLIELYYLILNVLPVRKALSMWFLGLKIFIQNDRLG